MSQEINISENKNICPFEKNFEEYQMDSFCCTSDYTNLLQKKKEKLPLPATILFILITSLILIFSLYCMIAHMINVTPGFYSPSSNTTVILGTNSRPVHEKMTDEDGRYTVAGLAEAVGPSIVEIITYSDITCKEATGSGSGIIMSEDGYIITNAHVISSSKYLMVTLHDNTTLSASITGYDSKSDIAVIKIEPADNKLSVAEFGNSDEVIQGEQVVAIGNPGGLRGTITGGYVSAVNRKIKAATTSYEMNCIQTDAAISPGNSGGALINMCGQIIGITSSKYINNYYEGLGFAITINDAKPIIEELIADGYIKGRFKVGITFYGIDKKLATEQGLRAGLLIEKIDESCDISKSELKPGDIIYETEGLQVTDYDDFMEAINKNNKKAGDTVTARVYRKNEDGSSKEFTIRFKLMEDKSGDY